MIRTGLTLFLSLLLMACDNQRPKESYAMETITMQPEETEFLRKIYVNEDRIKEGRLLSYQLDTLERYRFGKQYLAEKYPGKAFEILYGDPATKATKYADFTFREQSGEDTYSLYVYEEEAGGYYGKDNFYGTIFSEVFDGWLCDELQADCRSVSAVSSSMPWVKGKEYDQNMTVEDVLSGRLELSTKTTIYVSDSGMTEVQMQGLVGELEERVKSLKLQGSFKVYVVEKDAALLKIQENGLQKEEYRYRKTFQTY